MNIDEALNIFNEPGRINPHIIQANDEQSQKYNNENREALLIAYKLLKERKTKEEITPISYSDCCNALLRMWMDNVLTDSEYNRIMDKLNAKEKKL